MESSPFPEGVESVHLHVHAGSPLAEIFLIDHQFNLRKRSVGDLDVDVKPGVYNLKARLADATVEQLVVLTRDSKIDLRDELVLPTPAPLAGASPTAAVRIAAEESSKVTTHNGQGAAIFLLTRSDGDKLDLVDLTLHRSDGTQIEDLCCDGSSAAGRTVAVDPGIYFMRWEDTSGVEAEQTLVAVKDWQTQVFMLDEADSSPEHGRHHVSVLMSRESFDPASEMLRRSEEARAALADERKIATDVVSRSLFAKSENPMMGLYGTHLMLLARGVDENSARVNAPVDFDQDLYDTAVQNLGRLLGEDNPDVIALSTKTSAPPDPLPSVAAPPMLWRSWLLLLDASSKSPDVVPLHVSRQVSKRLPMRPFLVWSPVSEEAADKWQAELGSIVESSSLGTRELSKQLLVPQAALESAAESTES